MRRLIELVKGFPGHPSHPPLTDVSIGAYTAGTLMLVLGALGVEEEQMAHGGLLAAAAAPSRRRSFQAPSHPATEPASAASTAHPPGNPAPHHDHERNYGGAAALGGLSSSLSDVRASRPSFAARPASMRARHSGASHAA